MKTNNKFIVTAAFIFIMAVFSFIGAFCVLCQDFEQVRAEDFGYPIVTPSPYDPGYPIFTSSPTLGGYPIVTPSPIMLTATPTINIPWIQTVIATLYVKTPTATATNILINTPINEGDISDIVQLTPLATRPKSLIVSGPEIEKITEFEAVHEVENQPGRRSSFAIGEHNFIHNLINKIIGFFGRVRLWMK